MSIYDLQDKIAIVTGGAGGIGSAISLEFANAGSHVIIADRKMESMEKVALKIRALGRQAVSIETDVTNPEQVNSLIKQTVDSFGRLDILVNVAGGALNNKKPEDKTLAEWNAIITLNLTGPFICSVAAAKVMMKQNKGKIVSISSTAGININPEMCDYAAAKAGLINLTKSLSVMWAPYNINVNVIAPGFTATEALKRMGLVPPLENTDGTPVPRLLHIPEPENIADGALFLASEASDHITGELMVIRSAVAIER